MNANSNIITFKQNAPTGTATYGVGVITFMHVGAASGTVNVNSNQLLTTGSSIRSTGNCIGINHDLSGAISTGIAINSNTISINRISSSGTITGTNESATPTTAAHTITNNNITFTGLAGSTTANGIMTLGGTSGTVKSINNNTINISGVNSGNSIGIQTGNSDGDMNNNSVTISTASPTITSYQATGSGSRTYTMTGNSLSLTSTSGSATAMQEFNVGATGPFQIYNNTFTLMSFTGTGSSSPQVSGIAIAAGTGNNI